jgi:hypothetical protein
MNTPKKLTDLKVQDWVIDVKGSISVEVEADRVFSELWPDDTRDTKVNFLFQEDDTDGNTYKVYEAYKDSGSDDYIYLKVRA